MKIKTLEDLLADELKDLYSAENQIVKALPKMAKTTQSRELRSAFEEHLRQTENQVQRLETGLQRIGDQPQRQKVRWHGRTARRGQGNHDERLADADAMEAGMIGAAQKVEHYEIAAYGTARAHARQLGFNSVAQLLNRTLEEEKMTDEKLTKIAENKVNVQAAMEH